MNNQEIFNTIRKEFSEEIAINATILIAINESLEPTDDELYDNSSYIERLTDQFNVSLSDVEEDVKNTSLAIWEVWSRFTLRKQLDGFGGCEEKVIRELIAEKDIDKSS